MRKWQPSAVAADTEWSVIYQIVIPLLYHKKILSIAHDMPMSGHLGINKTYHKILTHFYWPSLKKHVSQYCVGPLPKTKSGNQYLLTIMCASTRFPEAIPLRNIKSKSVVKALVKFFTLVGLLKIVQSN